ncbi:MAG: hypothetical protein WD250_03635 [Egibacteraceae bacterium]
MSTAEFHDDDMSVEDGVEDGVDDEVDDEVDGDVDLDELSDLDDVSIEVDDVDDADDDDDDAGTSAEDDEEVDDPPTEEEDEDEGDEETDDAEESLDVLLAREKVLDEDDLGRIAAESRTGLSVRPALIGADEFTCRSCFLVKRRAQLADEQRRLCFDCV